MMNGHKLPVRTELPSTEDYGKNMEAGKQVKLYLQLMALYTRLKIPSNDLRGMLTLHERQSPRFSPVTFLHRLARWGTGIYHVTCM